MESVISYYEEPVLNKPVLIEGLPGVGNVGKIAADFLAEKLEAKHFATVLSKHFPPQDTAIVCIANGNHLFWTIQAYRTPH